MDDMIIAPIYLIIGYGIFWLFSFVLLITMWARQRRIEQQITIIEAQLDDASDN